MGGGERASDGITAYHRACVVRNCVIDCEYKVNPVPISQITIAGTVATVMTGVPHGRSDDDWVRISGALENGSSTTTYNGSYQITYIDAYTFTYAPYDGVGHPRPTVNATGAIW